ncbi:hypothetical protein [Streptomyces sp. 147326]|uniref:hypothetical protein n=1 Tax=Streptomyces sp. 147326 TaxID=3074379 RepID=UPI003857F09B
MTNSLPTSECVFAEELLLEGYGGPSALYVRDQARGVVRAVHAGAAIAPDDTNKLVDLLGDPQAFINEPTEPAHLRGANRHDITARPGRARLGIALGVADLVVLARLVTADHTWSWSLTRAEPVT